MFLAIWFCSLGLPVWKFMTILYDFEKYSGLVVLHERWWCVPQGFICLRERDKFFKNGKRFPWKANSSPPSPSFKSTGEFLSKISFSWRGKLFLANLLGVVLHGGPVIIVYQRGREIWILRKWNFPPTMVGYTNILYTWWDTLEVQLCKDLSLSSLVKRVQRLRHIQFPFHPDLGYWHIWKVTR